MTHSLAKRIALFALLFPVVAFSIRAQKEPYAVVHGWPILPDGYVLGQVSGVAVDSHNHVFIFHRAEGSWATDQANGVAEIRRQPGEGRHRRGTQLVVQQCHQ